MSEKKKRTRGQNYTAQEKELLADLVMQYKHIIEDKRTGGIYVTKKKDAWEIITRKFNSSCVSGRRETEQLKALYDNMKQKIRKNVGETNKNEYLQRVITKEDVARALQNIKEDKVQMKKTGGGNYKPKTTDSDEKVLAIIQDQVEPLPNPYDSGANYFKDVIVLEELECDSECVLPMPLDNNDTPGDTECVLPMQLDNNDTPGEPEYVIPMPLDSNKENLEENNVPPTSSTQKRVIKKKKLKKMIPKLKKNTSAESLKQIYFKKKCQNAQLEKKRLLLNMVYMKKEHNLKMAILKKQLENN